MGPRPSVCRLLAIRMQRGTLWRRETYDFLLGERSASSRSAAILPLGEDIFKVYDTFPLPKRICWSYIVLSGSGESSQWPKGIGIFRRKLMSLRNQDYVDILDGQRGQ